MAEKLAHALVPRPRLFLVLLANISFPKSHIEVTEAGHLASHHLTMSQRGIIMREAIKVSKKIGKQVGIFILLITFLVVAHVIPMLITNSVDPSLSF